MSSMERYQGVLCREVPSCSPRRGTKVSSTKVSSVERYQAVLSLPMSTELEGGS